MTVFDDLKTDREAAEDALKKKVEDLRKAVNPQLGQSLHQVARLKGTYLV